MALIEVEVDGRLGWLTFNRPEKLNALSPEMFEGFVTSFRELAANDDVRVILLRGTGRAFSVGFDVDRDSNDKQDQERITALEDWIGLREIVDRWLEVWRCPKPVIAAVHGYCMGLATQLAVCCDLTVVAKDAVIGWPSLPLGGGLLGTTSCWLIGPKKAKELSYIAGSRLSGEEAFDLGWANYAVDADEVQEKARVPGRAHRQDAARPAAAEEDGGQPRHGRAGLPGGDHLRRRVGRHRARLARDAVDRREGARARHQGRHRVVRAGRMSAAGDDILRVARDGGVATITLNRPDRLNAWTTPLELRYAAALRELARDPDVRAVVVTGAGRGYSAGWDMEELRDVERLGRAGRRQRGEHRRRRHPRLPEAARRRHQRLLRRARAGPGAGVRPALRARGRQADDELREDRA